MPLGVGVEDAEGGVGAEDRDEDAEAEGFDDPGGIDQVDHLGWGCAALRVIAGGLAVFWWGGHGSLVACPASHAGIRTGGRG